MLLRNNSKNLVILSLIISMCVLLVGCDIYSVNNKIPPKIWVYLCGLTYDVDSLEETNNRQKLSQIAHEQGIEILYLTPFSRCEGFDNKLCWPHQNREQVLKTYSNILTKIPKDRISGYIGFSNGGFFLNQLAQLVELDVPIITIGSGGYFDTLSTTRANIYLIIGKQDYFHYDIAKQFYSKVNSHGYINIELIEHARGHIIPSDILNELLRTIADKT